MKEEHQARFVLPMCRTTLSQLHYPLAICKCAGGGWGYVIAVQFIEEAHIHASYILLSILNFREYISLRDSSDEDDLIMQNALASSLDISKTSIPG